MGEDEKGTFYLISTKHPFKNYRLHFSGLMMTECLICLQSNCTLVCRAKSPGMSLCYRGQLSLPAICLHYWFIHHLFTLSVHLPSKVGKCAITKFGSSILMSSFLAHFAGSSFSNANNLRLALIASLINCLTRVKICLERQILLPHASDNVKAQCSVSKTAADPRIQMFFPRYLTLFFE